MIMAINTRLVLLRDSDRGANLVEYALLVAFIAMAAVFALTQVGGEVSENISDVVPGLGG